MALLNEYIKSGNYLFRKRSFIPLVLYVLATLVIVIDRADILYEPDRWWSGICLVVSLSGLAIRIMVIGTVPGGTSGRNTTKQVARSLNTRGIYSIVRHPLYLGNFLMWLGLIIYVGNVWFMLVSALLFWIYYERIMFAEEDFLEEKFGDDFHEWASQTPAFIPSIKKWKSPELHFSVKKVIRREYRGQFALIVTFVYLNLLKNYMVLGKLDLSGHWTVLLILGAILFVVVHLIKKQTTWLKTNKQRQGTS
jgi:protein-S-isoprenylcysteine O-methyltransferase Ste14